MATQSSMPSLKWSLVPRYDSRRLKPGFSNFSSMCSPLAYHKFSVLPNEVFMSPHPPKTSGTSDILSAVSTQGQASPKMSLEGFCKAYQYGYINHSFLWRRNPLLGIFAFSRDIHSYKSGRQAILLSRIPAATYNLRGWPSMRACQDEWCRAVHGPELSVMPDSCFSSVYLILFTAIQSLLLFKAVFVLSSTTMYRYGMATACYSPNELAPCLQKPRPAVTVLDLE